MKCTTCEHRKTDGGKTRCEILKTTVDNVGNYDMGESLPACQYEKKKEAKQK